MLQLIGWRLRQMVRDVPMMFWGLAFPIIMGILFQAVSYTHLTLPTMDAV